MRAGDDMSMLVFVYRNGNGSSTNGVSSRVDQLFATAPGLEGPFKDTEWSNTLLINEDARGNLRLIPMDLINKNPMFGGNFAGTSDSRWARYLEQRLGFNPRVLPIFDRIE